MRANLALRPCGALPHVTRHSASRHGAIRWRSGLPLLAALLVGCGSGVPDNSYQPPPPPEVTVAKPLQQTVTLFIEENGETEAVERAEVRARVRGFLEEIKFEPGQKVEKDDVLYVIQRNEYQAALNSAKAALAAAEAAVQVSQAQIGVVEVEVTRAEFDFKRFKSLLEKEAATQAQYDEALAARDAAVATHEAAKANALAAQADRDKAAANLEQAQLDFDYTLVKSPISGRITKTEIKLGNLVDDGSLMATVVDRDRIFANFNVSDRAVLRLQQAAREQAGGDKPDEDYRTMTAALRREIDDGFPFEGRLDYIDQEGVDQATGTFALRAGFDNPDDMILPGLFVRIRVPIGQLDNALLIPERGLAKDQRGPYVLIVDADNKVGRRSVTIGQTYENMVVIQEGIGPDDRVLLDGGQRARPGSVVTPVDNPLSALPDPAKQDSQPEEGVQDDTEADDDLPADANADADNGSGDSPPQP